MVCLNLRSFGGSAATGSSRGLALAGGLACAAAVFGLAGCSGTTYGTGVDPGTQTLRDIAGIALMGGGKKPSIDYEPRAKVVAPPTGANAPLPPPQAAPNTAADAAVVASNGGDANPPNWPNDPDIAAAKFKADIAAREARGEPAPKLKIPPELLPHYDGPATVDQMRGGPATKTYSADELAKIKKAFADAKGSLAVDANGQPVRRYLTEPPVELRQPDPTQPVEFTEKKKKFHWWWQKQDDTDSLTPVTSSDGSTQPAGTPPATN